MRNGARTFNGYNVAGYLAPSGACLILQLLGMLALSCGAVEQRNVWPSAVQVTILRPSVPTSQQWGLHDSRAALRQRAQRRITLYKAAQDSNAEQARVSSEAKPQLVEERKNQPAEQYSLLSKIAAVLAFLLLLAPPSFLVLRLDGHYSVAEIGLARLIGASLWSQAAALRALSSAAVHGRLSSDTYKRFNIGLAAWGTLTLILSITHASALTNIFWFQTILAVACLVRSGKALSEHRPQLQVQKLVSSFQHNKNEFGWIFSFLTILSSALGLGLLAAPFAVFEPSKWRPQPSLVSSFLLRSYAAGLLFSSILFYTLKDAEDRGRSTSSTFQLAAQALLLAALSNVAVFISGGLWQVAIRDGLLGLVMVIFLVQRQKQPQS